MSATESSVLRLVRAWMWGSCSPSPESSGVAGGPQDRFDGAPSASCVTVYVMRRLKVWVKRGESFPRKPLDRMTLWFYVEAFEERVKVLRPTLRDLYHRTLSYNAEHTEVRDRLRELERPPQPDPSADPVEFRRMASLRAEEAALSANADANGQAFVMVLNPVLQELRRRSGLNLYDTGPELDGVRLGRLSMLLADQVRHHHSLSRIGLNHLLISADHRSDDYGEMLAGIGINAKAPSAARAVLVRYAKPSYQEFEDDIVKIGSDLVENAFPPQIV